MGFFTKCLEIGTFEKPEQALIVIKINKTYTLTGCRDFDARIIVSLFQSLTIIHKDII